MTAELRITPYVSLDDLSIEFITGTGKETKQLRAVDRVSLSVAKHELVCVIGPSGCGKTTMLNALTGLLQRDPNVVMTGDIRIEGIDLERGSMGEIAYMFQKDTLLPWLTARENVRLPLRFRKAGAQKKDMELVESFLTRVGLGGFGDYYPSRLSGGMRKRLQLAQILAQGASLILMDEPFAALDALTRAQMHREFIDLWSAGTSTVVFVTHDISEALLLADRVICMSNRPAKIVADVPVPLPRPRAPETMAQNETYERLLAELWRTMNEVNASS
jgi:NitT/TauT family transport system ATP-binding protein